jgi:hypothetical protein
VTAAFNALDGNSLGRLLDRAADLDWKLPTWNCYFMSNSMFRNEFYAPQVIGVVLDRFRDVDITEESFFFGSMREVMLTCKTTQMGWQSSVAQIRRQDYQ